MKPAEASFDLPRLDANAQPLLSEAVATLRSNGPDATELASLASRLALAGVDVTLPAPATATAPVRWKKWLAGGGAASGALIWLISSVKPPAPQAAAPQAQSRTVEIEARSQTPRGVVGAQSRAKSAALEPSLPSPRPLELAQPAIPAPREDEQAPPVAHDAVADSGEQAPSLAPTVTGSTPPHAASNGTHATNGAQAPTPELGAAPSEIELLRDARLALKQAPARALTLVEAHARAYPAGKLTQERELLGISALVAVGRRTAALSRGARFQRDFPNSPYRDQVQQLLR